MRFYFHPDADAEFDKVVDYYEECQPGLGIEFAEHPHAGPDLHRPGAGCH